MRLGRGSNSQTLDSQSDALPTGLWSPTDMTKTLVFLASLGRHCSSELLSNPLKFGHVCLDRNDVVSH